MSNVKEQVFSTESPSEEAMRQKIIDAFNKLRSEASQIFPRVQRDIVRRAHACLSVHGRNFEHLPLT